MKRKVFYFVGSILSMIIFVVFYSYFWYTIGKYPARASNVGDAILMMVYFLMLIWVAVGQYKSPYHELKNSVISILLYAIPLLLIFIMLLPEGGFNILDIQDPVFTLPLSGLFVLNLLNYVLSIFGKE